MEAKFIEIGDEAGVAFSGDGQARSGMGVDSADFNQDGWHGPVRRQYRSRDLSIYQNNHDETFDDMALADRDRQGDQVDERMGPEVFRLRQRWRIWICFWRTGIRTISSSCLHGRHVPGAAHAHHNTGKDFRTSARQSGPVFSNAACRRAGMALGDFDNDGAVDVLISVNGGRAGAAAQPAGRQNHWLGIRLIGKKSNPDAVGARITYQSGELKRGHLKVGGGSYLSAHDPRMVLGLGAREKLTGLK